MKITINNLGPIQQANFDFDKKLSVFCGPNNTGKTYLSYVLYAFTRQRIFAFEESLTDAQLNDFFVKRSLLLTINFERIYEAISKRRFSMPGDMATIFGMSETNAEKLFADFEMHISMDKDVYVANLKEREIDVTISTKGQSLAQVTKKSGENVLLVQNISSSLDIDREAIKDELLNQIYKILSLPVFFSHFFPVERIGLYTYYKDIMANRSQLMGLLQRLENGNRQALLDYISRNSSRYPVAVSYTLDAANKMSVLSQERGYYANLADDIEEDILGGKLSLTDEGDLILDPFNGSGTTGIVANKLKRKYIIMLSSAPEEMNEQLQKWGYTKDMGIKPQEVGAYLFNYGEGENMVNVTPIEVNDYGFEVKTIDDSINKQNEISETLYYELKYEHNK